MGLTVLITSEEECWPAATVLGDQCERDLGEVSVEANIRRLQVGKEPAAHREAIYTTLQKLYHVKHDTLFIVCLMHGPAADEYRRVHDFCASTKPMIQNVQVVTSLAEHADAGLLMRNLARKITNVASRH
uniref:Uncharacterized protein n=1 Tax=Neobodo designis TaxID=312471 RepID=A0A7S1QAG8_NEODS|mmetsp:Transcript_36708/g.113156  ORF Transcript_36708/g.113156 Transcript_36708/m.113156 type:complete len:130 (+) Transcript_36708:26-415(+)